MKRTDIARVLFAASMIFILAGGLSAQDGGAASAPAVALPEIKSTADTDIRNKAFDEALSGNFSESLELFQQAMKKSPDDKISAEATEILRKQIALLDKADKEKQAEYDAAVKKLGRCFLTQEYLATLKKNGIDKALRKKISEDIYEAFRKIGTVLTLEDADNEQVGKLKQQSLDAIKQVRKFASEAVELLEDDKSEYAQAFQKLCETLDERLNLLKKFFTLLDTDTQEKKHHAMKELFPLEQNLIRSMDDLIGMVSETPWRNALIVARLARELAPDGEEIKSQPWYGTLLDTVEREGSQASVKGDWLIALAAFANLNDLEPCNNSYKEKMDQADLRVHIMDYYGRYPTSQSTSKPAEERPAQKMLWKERTQGIDSTLVKLIISRVSESYVFPVDFRKLTRGALNSIKVLAEAEETAHTFDLLKDEDKKKKFLQGIQDELDGLDAKDDVDHLYLQFTLNSILAHSDASVKIPVAVIAMEFAEGFVRELDKFSKVYWSQDIKEFQKNVMGHFCGIGVRITKETGKPLKVVAPLEGTPAWKAGLKNGDLILSVDGEETNKFTINELVKKITGPRGTDVELKISRRGLDDPFDVSVMRDNIIIRTVMGWKRKSEGGWDFSLAAELGVGYIKITNFTGQTHADLLKAIEQLREKGATSLVIDLRSDPGGLLGSATDIADEFLDHGKYPIVSTKGRQTLRTVTAKEGGKILDENVIVLINDKSASASEILSGALKDWNRGLIVGERTYGKGSVQNVIRIGGTTSPKALLKLTTAYYYLPKGRLLHRQNGKKDWGVDPHVFVDFTPRQLRLWMEISRKTEILRDIDAELLNEDLREQLDADIQLTTALCLLKLMRLKSQSEQQEIAR